ncbi:MAG: YrhC family protein [Bacillaceae bacterium]
MKARKQAKEKMKDYNTFGKILLAVSTMLFLGLVVASEGKTNAQLNVIAVATLFSTGGAALFLRYSIKMQNKYHEN